MFKSIRGINRTDSGAIWTRICEDIVNFEKFPHPPKKNPPVIKNNLDRRQIDTYSLKLHDLKIVMKGERGCKCHYFI